jgi:hypothetical protein
MWRVWERKEGCTGCWWGNLRERPLGRPRRRWEDNIKMDVQELGGGRGDWMELAQDRDRWRALVSSVCRYRHVYQCACFLFVVLISIIMIIFSGSAAQCRLWLPRSRGIFITHDAPQSVGLFWTSD